MSYKPNKHQTISLLNGGISLIEPIDKDRTKYLEVANDKKVIPYLKYSIIEDFSQLQVGDTFTVDDKTFEVLTVEVKKVQKLNANNWLCLMSLALFGDVFTEDWYDEQYGEGSYEYNSYVFYITVKEKDNANRRVY